MAKQVRLRRGTTEEHSSFTGALGEVTVDTTKKALVVHDGETAGGIPQGNVNSARKVEGGGLATGGGDLSADRTITVTKATAANFRGKTTDDAALTPKQVFDAAAPVTLTQASTIAVDMATGLNFETTMTGNRELGNPTNVVPGTSGSIRIIQDGTGSRTLSYASNWKFAGGSAPSLSTAANAVDVLHWKAWASNFIEASLSKDVK